MKANLYLDGDRMQILLTPENALDQNAIESVSTRRRVARFAKTTASIGPSWLNRMLYHSTQKTCLMVVCAGQKREKVSATTVPPCQAS